MIYVNKMLTPNDSLEMDVLKVVFNASQMRLRRCEIRTHLRSKYEKDYAEGSFDVVLQRKLDSLRVQGLLEKDYVERMTFYFIPNDMETQVQRILIRDDIYDFTNSFDTKWLRMLRGLLNSLRRESIDPYVYFQSNCLAFVGGMSRTFDKSVEGMKALIKWERLLETRAQKEGITKEEYWRKMLRKATSMPKGVPKMLTYLGCTEKEIEDLRERQRGTFEVIRRTKKKR